MKKIDDSYFRIPLRAFLQQKAKNRIIFPISFEELGIVQSRTYAEMHCLIPGFIARAKIENIELHVLLCYHEKKYLFITKEFQHMRKAYCIDIPYGHWNHYEDVIANINQTVSENGMVLLAVCNIPYFLKFKLIIECVDGEEDKIKDIIHTNNLTLDFSKGLDELQRDMTNRIWNILVLSTTSDRESLHKDIQQMFFFPNIDELHTKGYKWEHQAKRKQVFISYSHKDQNIVRDVVDKLLECEVNVFVDYRSIDFGEKIIEKITQGLTECDLCVFFLSKHFKESYYAKHELTNIWNYIITGKKKWLLVILDDIDINEIYEGLSFYKYFKFNNDTDKLIDVIKKLMLP